MRQDPADDAADPAGASRIPDRAGTEHYGLQLRAETGLPAGTIYPIVARLEQLSRVHSSWEDPHEHAAAGDPQRRYYRLRRRARPGGPARWRQEWLGDLSVLPTRRARVRFAAQTLRGMARLAVILRQPAGHYWHRPAGGSWARRPGGHHRPGHHPDRSASRR